MQVGIMEEETLDTILNGLVRVYQKKKGYRFSLDSILLAHFVSLRQRTRFLDIGCGSGIILLILAKRFPNIHCVGLEIQENLATLARKNSQLNNLDERVEIISGDARYIKNIFPEHSFDAVIFNPPYGKLNSGRINPHQEKAIARHEIKGSLKDFLSAAKYLLKPKGRVFTIYPAKRLVELVYFFRQIGVEPKRMKLVFSDLYSDAAFALVEGKNGSREELKLESPLFIYDQNKKYTQEMTGIFTELSRFPVDGGG
ncbi:MAG: tRNA1(Val) (adenine(37)-N6)-methyltransferase [Deltaproteobacteria bacterium]|nr:tRNA1(Val) (adenine(37)-N6)-methyltransferase [Deltaproteobacteria bacterium]